MRGLVHLFRCVIWAALSGLLIEVAWWALTRSPKFIETRASRAWDASASWTGGGCEL